MFSHALAKSFALVVFSLFLLCNTTTITAQTFSDPGFASDLVATLPVYKPVGLTFAPDGRMFIWQENGIVRVYKNGVLLTTPFLDISSRVNAVGDRGLMGLALDPNFATNGYVYLYYTYEPNGNPNDVGAKTLRLTRVKADPANPDVALANSETVILGSSTTAPCAQNTDCISSDSDSHIGGTLRFGLDGKLYLSTGDGASYSFEDPLALRSQSLSSLNGKILRINTDGTAPSDNPFYDGTNSVKSKIYAYGFRNPYRFAIHPTTGEVLVADVGWAAYEEVNRGRGANFGWPCFEGDSPQVSYQSKFPSTCGAIPASSVTKPIYFYGHSVGQAIIGGPVYSATQFPAAYRGNMFFSDYSSQWIKRLVFDASGNVSNVQTFATGTGGIVSMEQGRDGALYYIVLETGQVRRIRYASAPTAAITATPTTGASPLAVSFSSAGSSDPNNLALTYLWDFGDGTTSTQANPVHTYTSATYTTFTAKLTVTNSSNGTASATVTVSVGNRPPVATITAPTNGTVARPGDTITYRGTASDPDETLSANAMSWQLLLHHDDHVHPYQAVTGASGSFVVEDHGAGTFYYEILLTVTDSRGATNTKSVNVNVASSNTSTMTYLSDLNWASATNGWGPVEKDRSNGEQGATDGRTIALNGVTYQKGLGVHANSDVRFALNGAYKTFAADVGVDDEVGSYGSVVFQVYADGTLLYDSGTMLGSSATKQLSVDVTGRNELRLFVSTAGDNDWYDHADWANARLLTGATQNTPPTVSLTAPVNNASFTAPANITITANAADSDGTISRVEFYQGSTLIGTDTSSPYAFTWNSVGAGNYTLSAKAFDNSGAATTSGTVNITVNAPSNAAPSASITAPTNNAVFTAPASITINANAGDSDGMVAKVEFYNGSTLLGTDTLAPYSFTWANVAAGTYALTVKATDDRGAVTTSSVVNITVNAPVSGLPAPWQKQDVGGVGVAGDTTYANGQFTLKGSGSDIWDFSDSFHFVWQPLARDGEIVARVVNVQNTDAWAKSGVMIRSSLAANAPYAAMLITPSRGLSYQWRYFINGNSGSQNSSAATVPRWVRLVRQGENLSGYTSTDGVTWTLLQTQTIPDLPGTVYIGLAVTSHNNGMLCTATFDNVVVK
ncbi:MAG: PQQ-dependent sugar dehydrogenase [Acidobacteria bacterium]|nr:PQQ-dependent sugar dehydrogenase [Acidobacteriota bacterium]